MTRDPWPVNTAHTQTGAHVRFEWGLAGARSITGGVSVAVVVDVLSFTTALSVAIDTGMEVLPYPWKDASAQAFAEEHHATLAVSRGETGPGTITLSAASIRNARGIERLVLPSPNGSTISHSLSAEGVTVVGASLRNRTAVAGWIDRAADRQRDAVAIIAAGERWPDGSLRPAIEDLWGAGAVIAALHGLGWTGLSPEARMAMMAFSAVESEIAGELARCASGKELIDIGFGEDVDAATEQDFSGHVPVLRDGRFTRAHSP